MRDTIDVTACFRQSKRREKEVGVVLITEVASHSSCGHILLIRSESASGSSHTQGEIAQGCEQQEAVMTGSI